MAKISASRGETIIMNDLLKQHLHPIGTDGYWKYDLGWNDENIAKATNPRLSANHTTNLRLELFGKLASAKKEAAVDRIDAHARFLGKLLTQHNALCDRLSKSSLIQADQFKVDISELEV